MATDFGSVDYSQYGDWEKVSTPSGGTYYIVPGTAWVYDPYLSQAKGRPILFQNPKASLKEKEDAKKQQERANSVVGQAAPILGGIAGTVGSAYAIDKLGVGTAAAGAAKTGTAVAGTAGAETAAGSAFTGSAIPEISSIVAADSPLLTAGVAAPAEASAFGAPSLAGLGAMPTLPLLGIAAGTYLGGKSAYDMFTGKGKAWQDASLMDNAGRVTLGIATGGLSELGNYALNHHKTTDERSQDRFGSLDGTQGNAAFGSMVAQGMQESVDDKDTWDIGQDKAAAPIDLMTRSYGVLKTFGPEWAKLTPAQRSEITTKMVNEDLINSKQGDYLVDNQNRAREIKDQVVGAAAPAATGQPDAGTLRRWRQQGEELANRMNAKG